MSWAEKRKDYLQIEKKKTDSPVSVDNGKGWATKRQSYLEKQEVENSIDWNQTSAELKKKLATSLGSGDFDKDVSRGLVESYAGVQFKIFDENLKKGYTGIKPIGENLSNLFKAHGYDFGELYPDLAEMYSSGNDENGGAGNMEAYAYGASDKFKAEWNKQQEYNAVKDALLGMAVAKNKKNEYKREAKALSDEKREIEGHSGGYGNWKGVISDGYDEERLSEINAELPEKRKEAAAAAYNEVLEGEAYNSISKGFEVRKNPDFEEKSSYILGNDGKMMSTEDAYDEEMWGISKDDYLTYVYLLNTEGERAANDFYSSIKNTVNAAEAEKISAYHQELEEGDFGDKASSALRQTGRAFASGIESLGQAAKGVVDTFTGDTEYFMPGVSQMVAAKNRDDASLVGKLALGATEGLPQVLGTAAIGAINPVLGSAFLGSTAYGSAYVDAINSGATRAEATGMGVASAALEIALEKYVGNTIEGFGTSLSKKAVSGISKTKIGQRFFSSFDDFAKVHPKRAVALATVGKMFGNSSSEFVEEYLAETVSPLLRNLILGENNDFTLWSDAQKEAGLIGFITGGVLEGVRGGITLSNLGTDYGIRTEAIKIMSDAKALSEYKEKFGSDAESADKARAFLLDSERFVASVAATSKYAKEGLSYEKAIEKVENSGIDIGGFEEFTRCAYELGKIEADNGFVSEKDSDYKTFYNKLAEAKKETSIMPKVFSVNKNSLPKRQRISESILDFFNSIGNKAVNSELGVVELTKSGAKSTSFHRDIKRRAGAILAIKDVIEKGEIVSSEKNWKGRGYDTYMIVGHGDVDGRDSIVGVIVKSYPKEAVNKKFYLHDVIEIGAETDVATENGVKTNVNNESAPIGDIISHSSEDVNRLTEQGEATSYISEITGVDAGSINRVKMRLFAESLKSTSMSDFDKANAIKRYTLKEQALDRMYEMGASGLEFDASMSAGVISDADAYKAFIRGENARQEKVTSRIFDEAPTAPFEADDGDNLKGDTLDDSSIVLENDEASYPYDEKSVIDGYENAVDKKILDFINRIRGISDDSRKKKQYLVFSDVKPDSRLSKDVKRLTGVTADGFKNRLDGNDFLHIEAEHGKNGRTDHSMGNDNDLARIGFVIDNYDTIEIVTDKNGTPDTDYEHQSSDQTPSKMVKMSKKINGTYYVVESIPDSKSKSIYVKSAYISKDGSKPRPLNISKDLQLTSETLYSQKATTNGSISDSSSDVNTVINSMGSGGVALYNRILEPIAKGTNTKANLEAYRSGFAHVYESGLKGVPYKRSKASPLTLKQINAIYDAAKMDAQARANVKKKADAKIIKDDTFTKAKVSKRTERILGGVAKVVGRDIRFSDDIEGNAKIDLATGEIIISTKAKSGHTWAMIHEVYHALVVDSPAEAAVLKKTVLDIARKNPAAFRKMLEKYESVYADELFDNGDEVKHSKAVDLSGKEYWQIDTDKDIFKNLTDTKDLQNAAYDYLLNGEKGERVTDIIDGEELQFRRIGAREYVYGTASKTLKGDTYKQKMRLSPSVIDLIDNANITYDSPDHKNHKMFPDGFKNYQGRVGIDDTIFRYIVRVGKAIDGKVFYDISLEVDDAKVPSAKKHVSHIISSTSNNNYTQKSKNVNTSNEKHSKDLSVANVLYDKNGNFRIDAAAYITEEMVADLIGYTLSDPAILESLTGQQRTVMQKFVDKLVSMFGDKNLKAASEYLSNADADIRAVFKDVAKEADTIAEQFRAALDTSKKAEKNTVERDGVRSSKDLFGEVNEDAISEIRSIGRKNINDLTSDEVKAAEPFARLMWKTLKEKSPFFRAWFGEWRANDTKTAIRHVTVQSDTRGLHRNIDTGWDINHSAKVHTESHNSKASISGKAFLPYIDGIIENAVLLNSEISDNKNENSIMFHSLYSVVNDRDNKAIIKLIVEEMKNPGKNIERRAYKLVDIEKLPTSALGSQKANLFTEVDSINNISQLIEIVKTYDKSFNPKPSSVVVDENGMPKKVYHSTSEKFDTFDITKSRSWNGTPDYDLPGFYFSENYEDSAAYGGNVGEYYIKITKPYEGDVYSLRNEKGSYRAAYEYLVENGYDGVIIDELGEGSYEYIVLKDVNVKSATDNIGTYDSNNANTKMSKELFPDDRTMSAEEIENDEIEQMVQSIISSDDLSDADVKAIREEIINSKKQIREKLLADITTTNLARWGMDIGRNENAAKMSIEEAVKKVKDSFGITITDGKDASVAGSAVSSYNENTRTIRTKFRNDLPAICHSLGYHIDNTLGVVDKVIEQTAKVRELEGDGVSEREQELRRLSNYEGDDTRKAIKEGFAEFIRLYLVSKNLAQADAPIFYSEFEYMLQEDEKLQNAVETSAQAVSGYFVQSAEDRGSGAIMTKAEWDKLNKESLGKRLKSGQTRLIQAITDSFYAIKAVEKSHGVFDLTTSDTGYVKASMTRTSRSRAARILMDAFYDADGNRIGDSFLDIIKPLGKENSKKMEDFGNYLTFVHAIEWIEPNKLEGKKTSSGKDIYNAKAKGHVFKDETLNDANELRRIIASMEERHPDFKAIAKKVYEFQDNLMKYYLIPSGALSQDQAETFRAQYPHYVPFNRFNTVFGDVTGKRNRSLFANLRNPIQKADGGDAPIRNPIESIMNSTYAAVDFYDKQATMAAIASEFAGMNAIPGVMSRIYSTKQLQELEDKGKNPFVVEKIVVGKKNSGDRDINEIDISLDNELSKRIAGLSGSEKYNRIRDYIIENIGYEEFELSDGTKAKIDRSDALHIANKSAGKKTAYISQIKEIIKKARLYQVDTNVSHKKFNEFRYYLVNVKIDGEVYPIYLNVGKANNGDGYHLYDVTKKIGGFAKQNALERVNKDLRSEIEAPNDIISQQSENVNIGFNEDKNASFNPVADKEKGIVYRWVNGEKWFYQVYDRDLFNALSSLDVEQLTKGWRFLNTMSNVLKRTMTMWNPIFSTGNAIKDFQSFKKNTVTNAGVLGSLGMYVSSARSFITQDEYFRLYRAMGGMDSTRLNADEDSLRKAVRSGVRKNTKLFSPSEMRELWKYSKVEWFKRVDIVRNLVDSFFAFNDFVETLPRLAEFKNSMNMSESKGDSQLAFYRSQDVTTDFSRKGTQGRKINAIFLFSNANLQGIDKFIRTYTESGYTRKNGKGELSKANLAKKIISNLTFDLLMTALIAFLHRDEKDREEYRRLSDFTKNNYYCFHVGGGNFIKIPKGENSSLPQTLTQSLWDASQGNDIDLSELGGYVWECFFPDFLPNAVDVFTEDSIEGGLKAAANAPLNKMPTSVFTDVLLNRDYKGDEIVPDYMGNYENNFEKYTGSTSKFSVDLAKSLYTSAGIDISPMSLDHFFGAAGWYGSFATKMMPSVSDDGNETFGEEFWNAFGLERKFTADARYSTDLLNDFYDERDKLAGKAKVKLTSKNLIRNEKYQAMSSFMSGYNKASRNGSQEQQRLDRRMLQMMLEDFGEGDYTEGEEYVMRLYDSTKNDKVFKASFPKAEFTANVKVGKKKLKKEVSLDANTYSRFCADISNMRERVRILVRDMGIDDVTAASFLEGAYTDIDADMKVKYAEKYGKDPAVTEDSSKKTEVSKQEQSFFDKAYEEVLNNIIYG